MPTLTDLATLPARVVWALVATLAVVIGAYVFLAAAGLDVSAFMTFVVTVGGLAGLGARGEARSRRDRRVLDKIDHQTNGVLTARIKTAVTAAMAERDAQER